MARGSKTPEEYEKKIAELKARLHEAEEVLRAIGRGDVDAIMITGPEGDQVALILTPATEGAGAKSPLSREGSAQIVARNVRVGEVDRVVRLRREHSEQGIRGLELGVSTHARQLRNIMKASAENDSTILLQGETGTGKGIIARWIYEHSNRSKFAFVEINCASLKGDLLANELFGHERGAFTSATEQKPGLLDVANGGTVFLDEIGDMDLGVQSQFLKVLEEKRFRRLGSVSERHSEFRLICATNRNLHEEIRAGRFRKDLFYRIHIFPLEILPLRERKEDIPVLAGSILQSISGGTATLNRPALKLLQEYDWPGNIRELRNVLERARLLSNGSVLTKEHFPGLAQPESPNEVQAEPERIRSALQRFKGNKKKAAEFLGISRITLYRKLDQLKIR